MIKRLMLIVVLCLAVSEDSHAQKRTLYASEGVPLRITHYVWFAFEGCKSLGLPQVLNIRTSAGAKVWVQAEDLPMGSTTNPKGAHCIGKTINSAAVYFLSRPGFEGLETVDYLVRYPTVCTNCKSQEVSVQIKVLRKAPTDPIDTETTSREAR